MNHSAAALSDPEASDLATGYRYWFFWPVAFDAPYTRSTTPSGLLISSAEDMSHYLVAQLNGGTYGSSQLLSPQGIDTLHTPGARISTLSSYGMGWLIQGEPDSTKISHSGDLSNFHSNMLLLPDQNIGIVILTNVGEFYNNALMNAPINGIAEILLGKDLTATTTQPLSIIPQVVMLAVLLVPSLWMAGSYLSIRRWQRRGELPPRGIRRFWRFYLPLIIDLCPVVFVWIILPSSVDAPMEGIALFVPDVFMVILLLTALSLGWVVARTVLMLHPRRLDSSKDRL